MMFTTDFSKNRKNNKLEKSITLSDYMKNFKSMQIFKHSKQQEIMDQSDNKTKATITNR